MIPEQEVIEGGRIRLRPWTRGDNVAQELWPPYTDPFHNLWNLMRVDSSSGYSAGLSPAIRYAWAVEDSLRRLVGRISLREVDEAGRSARLGISLGAPYVGQGLGTEAMVYFLDHYFGPMGYLTMLLDVAAFNQRAVRSYESLGFRYIESDWRSAGNDPALRQLDDPRHAGYRPYFRRGRFETLVEFYEMHLNREEWLERRRQGHIPVMPG